MSDTLQGESVLFEETQRLGGVVTLAAIGGVAAIAAAALGISRKSPMPLPGVLGTLAAGVAVGTLFFSELRTRVSSREAVATLWPFPFATLRLRPQDIQQVTLHEYGLLSGPGGIGYHVSFGWRAATATTGTGVLVTRPDGVRCLIGTQRPDALMAALQQLRRAGAS